MSAIKYLLYCLGTFRIRIMLVFFIGSLLMYFFPNLVDSFVIHDGTDPTIATMILYSIVFLGVWGVTPRSNNKDSGYTVLNRFPLKMFYLENSSVSKQLRDCKKFLTQDPIPYRGYDLECEILRYYEIQGWSIAQIKKPLA